MFEVIKKAITSSVDSESEAINDLELKQPDNDTERVYMDAGESATVTTPPNSLFQGIFRQIIAAFSSMTLSQQITSVVAVCFVAKVTFFGKHHPRDADDLAQKVHELTNEIRDMKVILERILKMSERDTGETNAESEEVEL